MRVTDPVCNMTIEDENAAGVSEYKGKKYYFCAKHCEEKFDKDPETYIGYGDSPESTASPVILGQS
ncbi:MAG: YHS domain-containing protein, partial [Nitrospirota bacterium]|nr:YHS domain-containing protein [Nitrospirota bacterium]